MGRSNYRRNWAELVWGSQPSPNWVQIFSRLNDLTRLKKNQCKDMEQRPKHFDFGIVIYTTPKTKDGPKHFDFGIVIYTTPETKDGSKHFDFGIVIVHRQVHRLQRQRTRPQRRKRAQKVKKAPTISTLESWFTRLPKPKVGPERFDFGIVIYTNPTPKEGPEGISNGGTGKTVQGPSSTGKTVPQAIKQKCTRGAFRTRNNLNIGSGKTVRPFDIGGPKRSDRTAPYLTSYGSTARSIEREDSRWISSGWKVSIQS